MTTAALVVSISSAVITLGGLLAQLTLYRLSGARLKVQIVFCYAEQGSRIWISTGRGLPKFAAIGFEHTAPLGIEYGRVRVTNTGRTAVSVENISLDISDLPRRPRRRHRTAIQPRQFIHKHTDIKKNPLLKLADPLRLELRDNVTAEYNLWPALAGPINGTRNGPILVRGSAIAVGRKWATRSRMRHAWRLPKGAWTLFSDIEVTPRLRAYRELYRYNSYEGIASSTALLMHWEILNRLDEGITQEELKSYLDQHTRGRAGEYMNGMLAFDVHHAYHHEEPLLWTAPEPRRRGFVHRLLWGQGPQARS